MAVFQIGDKVETLDDVISGWVAKVAENEITIETGDGFLLNFAPDELVKVDKGQIQVSNLEASRVKAEKEAPKKRRGPAVRPKERNAPKMEVDLHIGQLVPSTKGLSNFDMLNLQLDTAKRQLEFAIRKRIQKMVFIHGVGEGVLKEELYSLFRRYDNVRYYDADYQKYGMGATEVYILQNH
ncbi:Smr/MutS family protein [Pseudozobellia thermophila]|uniref:Smr domain-containing protein n=1 Tax=Pseudozobellia thermophila TaxID=192903 RepID=A0A1M6J550_9FLAO|nr:Smr/MutS family protein [Pseudozobellia thermophila]SHJ41767.1 Smr domain-containing protein [Pseudozobellia thermophila]